ncbi:hypothetical protein [Mammaliicoccus vitulinus]|uniref:hypothetical protein n=1 Tax=Mammaliicoccus vitulinus TaxID=71237 RepID=UPI00248C670A|nr:hypothetical protein [Mammaliicoccus vitulinus]
MEIVKEIVEYNQTDMYFAKLIPIIIASVILISSIIKMISEIRRSKEQTIGEHIVYIVRVLIIYSVIIAVITIPIYMFLKQNAKYTSAKVDGKAILEKYEDEGEGKVMAKFKGKDNQEINIYLDSSDVLNQKEKISKGDKVQVKSDKPYALIKREAFISLMEDDSKEYILKQGSELEKVE